ncbi:MAG: hypothetical protein QM638_16830 [Nocardioides sp.]|uniref:hypothetical protein n=1 Tax=Nocardioides sp. TaxID=35761 RepID=UPI0039E30865
MDRRGGTIGAAVSLGTAALLLIGGLSPALAAADSGDAPFGRATTGASTDGTQFVGKYSALRIDFGQRWRAAGGVESADGTPVSGGTVLLGAKAWHGSWKQIRTDRTPASFDFVVTPKKRTAYQLCYVAPGAGTSTAASTDTAQCTTVMTVMVRRVLTLPVVHSAKRTLTGRVAPSYRHRRVVIQRSRCRGCEWHRARTTVTTKDSRWQVRIPVRKMRYRAVVRASRGYLRGVSPVQIVVVRRG